MQANRLRRRVRMALPNRSLWAKRVGKHKAAAPLVHLLGKMLEDRKVLTNETGF
jgi:hypothetical protein